MLTLKMIVLLAHHLHALGSRAVLGCRGQRSLQQIDPGLNLRPLTYWSRGFKSLDI